MVRSAESEGERPQGNGRCPPPRVKMPERGSFLGVAWSGAQGAGSQIVAARLAAEPDRVRLVRLWRPFQDAPSRRGVVDRLPAFLESEVRSAERRLTIGVDFPLGLAETSLRQLGLFRQAIAGPRTLGKAIAERYLAPGVDVGTAAEAVRSEIGRDRPRVAECYRAVSPVQGRNVRLRRALLGIVGVAGLDVDVLPWDPPRPDRPAVVEVHPPHVPRAMAGICGYRDGEGQGRPALRAAILRTLRSAVRLRFEMEDAAELVGDGTGATLDALLAAVAAGSARQGGFRQVPHDAPLCEGWIYSIPEEPWRA
jgi:Protein of unknown function (DUF429)